MVVHTSLFSCNISRLHDKMLYSLLALFVFVVISLPEVYDKTNKLTNTYNSTTKCPSSKGKFIHSLLFFIILFILTKLYEMRRFGTSNDGLVAKFVFCATLIYFALSSSDSYAISRSVLQADIASVEGCPNTKGILIHGLMFLAVMVLVMYFPKDQCPCPVVEQYNDGFDRDCTKYGDAQSCMANPNCGFCVSKNKHDTDNITTSCVVDNDDKTNHKPLFADCTTYTYGGATFIAPTQTTDTQQPASSQMELLQMLGLGKIVDAPSPSVPDPSVPDPNAQDPNIPDPSVTNPGTNENDDTVTTNNVSDFSYASNCGAYSNDQNACLNNVNCVVCGDDCVEGDEYGPYNVELDCKDKFMYKRGY